MHNNGTGMQGAEREGQNMRMMKRNLLLLMWAAHTLKSPLKGVFFLHKSAVTPPPQDNGNEEGGQQRGGLKSWKSDTALNAPEVIVAEDVVGGLQPGDDFSVHGG